MSHTHTDGVLFSPSKGNPAFCDNIDGLGDTISGISQSERQMLYDLVYVGSKTNQTHTDREEGGGCQWQEVGGKQAKADKRHRLPALSSGHTVHSMGTVCFICLFLLFFMVTIWIQYPTVYLKVV